MSWTGLWKLTFENTPRRRCKHTFNFLCFPLAELMTWDHRKFSNLPKVIVSSAQLWAFPCKTQNFYTLLGRQWPRRLPSLVRGMWSLWESRGCFPVPCWLVKASWQLHNNPFSWFTIPALSLPSSGFCCYTPLSRMTPVQSCFDFGGSFAKLRACFDIASRNTPQTTAVASFNPAIQQMLLIGPRMPSVAQPPSKWPFNLNCPPQRGPIKEEASRARITWWIFWGKETPGLPCQRLSASIHTLCGNEHYGLQ